MTRETAPSEAAAASDPRQTIGVPANDGSVDVTICGKAVRLGCEPGQESRIRRLAEIVEKRAQALSASGVTPVNTPFSRLVLMAALMLADELEEAESRLAEGGGAESASPAASPEKRAPADALDHAFARILIDAAQRLESVAQRIETT